MFRHSFQPFNPVLGLPCKQSNTSALATAATTAKTAQSYKPDETVQAVLHANNTRIKAKVPDLRNFQVI